MTGMLLRDKAIAIIYTNELIGVGLQCILEKHFASNIVFYFADYESFLEKKSEVTFELIMIHPEIYTVYGEQLKTIKKKLIILITYDFFENEPSAPECLNINLPKECIVNKLKEIVLHRTKHIADNQEVLSTREVDVLKYIALGFQNKQIAEQLCISSHTVISHRKNITRKLGLNTISGLTIYALINGLITTEDLQNPH